MNWSWDIDMDVVWDLDNFFYRIWPFDDLLDFIWFMDDLLYRIGFSYWNMNGNLDFLDHCFG